MQAESQELAASVVIPILLLDAAILFGFGRKHPQVPLMLIFALAPFQHDMSVGGPVRFSIAEINLMLTAILFFIRGCPVRWGPAAVPTALYLGVCTLSSLLHWRGSTLVSMVQMVLYMIVAVVVFAGYARNGEDYKWAFYGLIGIGLILAISVIVLRSGYVLKLHKNGVGASLCSAVIVCGELWFAATQPRKRMILTACLLILVAGLFFSLSRGAWVGASIGLMIILGMRRQFALMMRAAVFLIPLLVILWKMLPDNSRSYATGMSKKNYNINARYESLYFARDLFYESPVIGMGVGLRKDYDATNLFWLVAAETGVLGIMTFLGLHVSFVRMVLKTQKKLPRTETIYSAVAIGGAMITSKLIHGMVDHYWSRGSIMVVWTSAGMATHGYFVMRARVRAAKAARLARQQLADADAPA